MVVEELEDPPPHYVTAYPTEAAAKEAWNARLRREARQDQQVAQQAAGFTTYRPSTHCGVFDIDGPGSSMRPPGGFA